MTKLDNNVARDITNLLQKRLPAGWKALQKQAPAGGRYRPDLLMEVQAPGGARARIVVECKSRLEPRDVRQLAEQLRARTDSDKDANPLVIASFFSSGTRMRLKEAGLSFADATGNFWMTTARPGLYIETHGADRDPNRVDRPARTLKGPKASRIVRALCDGAGPFAVRKLAETAGIDPGYVSRVLTFLETEDLIVREQRGPIVEVRRRKLIERWSQDYSFVTSNRVVSYLEPLDIAQLAGKLSSLGPRVSITGSAAASTVAPVAPSRLIAAYVESPESAAKKLDLRPAESGANVLLAEPYDPVVFEGIRNIKGVPYAALSQVAVDLLTMPGRGPAEAQALLEWMESNDTRRS